MINVHYFTFSPFAENTYILFDETKECIIIDPGCYTQQEKDTLVDYIRQNELKPVRLINTHCHLDHVFGNKFVFDTYGLTPEIEKGELPVLQAYPNVCMQYGIPAEPSPEPKFISEEDTLTFGNSSLEILLTPGHSPASLSFYSKEDQFVIAGDTLFLGSIGRTDLPGGDYDTLIRSIKEKLLPLGDDVRVYAGHMGPTYIGHERNTNPFLTGEISM